MGEMVERPTAGWYEDPTGRGGQRYWDGAGWTSETRAPMSEIAERPRNARRGTLLVGAFATVLALGVVGGLLVANQIGSAPDAASVLAQPERTTGDQELPISLRLVGEVDRPTARSTGVLFTDVAALRDAGIVSEPMADGDGWSTSLQASSIGVPSPLWFPYATFEALRRAAPMEHVLGLTYDEISIAVGLYDDVPGWFVPDGGDATVRERLGSSAVWSETDADTFERVGDFTAEVLGGYEPDNIEQRLLGSQTEDAELRAGVLRLDGGNFTNRSDPLGQDPAWSSVLERLDAADAVSGVLLPHAELTALPEAGTPLQPAAASAMAAVIDAGGLSDLLVLEHDDPAAAEANAEAARTNLELLTGSCRCEGEVMVEGATVLITLRLIGDLAGTSDLLDTLQRFPGASAALLIGTGDATESEASPEQSPDNLALDGVEITVGSKDFDEQLILGEISVTLLEDAGAEVDNQVNQGGTDTTRAALESGEIDHYWEYTGTALISFFGEVTPIPDRVEQYEAVRDREAAEQGLFWLEPSAFNNTYGIALSREADAALGGVDTISELGALLRSDPAAVTLCVESEFNVRDDGLPGMEEHYGFRMPVANVTVLDLGAIYSATANRAPCTFGEVFTTDGRIAALDLKVLEDDRVFFPLYHAAPVFVEDLWAEYGSTLQELYDPVAAALDNDTMSVLNARVSDEGQLPADVARDWLTNHGFIG